jgi:hypothetical protein
VFPLSSDLRWAGVVGLLQGSGSGLSEEPVSGVPDRAGVRVVPCALPGSPCQRGPVAARRHLRWSRSAPDTSQPTPAAAAPARSGHEPAAHPAARRTGPIATAVCEPLCGSTPIIAAAMPSHSKDARCDHGGHALFQGLMGAFAPVMSHATAREPTGWHVLNQPGCTQPAGGSRASPPDPLDTTATTAAPAPILQQGGSSARFHLYARVPLPVAHGG